MKLGFSLVYLYFCIWISNQITMYKEEGVFQGAETLMDALRSDSIKSIDDVYEYIKAKPSALALYEKLRRTKPSIETIADLDNELTWIKFLNRSDAHTIQCDWFFDQEPTYYEEPDAFVITDTDFIPYKELTSYEDYEVAVSVLYAQCSHRTAYETIILALRSSGTNMFRKICLKSWKELLERIIQRLTGYQQRYNGESIKVRVPFFKYEDSIEGTIACYKRAILILETLYEDKVYDDDAVSTDDKHNRAVPMLVDAFREYAKSLEVFDLPGEDYIREELVRRGKVTIPIRSESNGYRIHLLGDKNAPSHVGDESTEKLDGELINRVGVLYCMLYGLVEDQSLLTKVAHFALNDNKPFKERPSANTEYSYIAHPLERLFDKWEKEEFVKKKLMQYGFPEDTLKRIENEIRQEKGQK